MDSVKLGNVAFENPGGERVLVAVNSDRAGEALQVTRDGKLFEAEMPAESTATFTWRR